MTRCSRPCLFVVGASIVVGVIACAVGEEALPPDERVSVLADRIDHLVARSYLGPVVPPATDTEFQRRIYLDLIGRGPTVEETEAFLGRIAAGEPVAEVREALIDDLLSRDDFSRYYAKVLEVMFTERRELISVLESRALIRGWLKDRRPLNELCLEMLAADGTGDELRAAASFVVNRKADPDLVTRDVGRIFFGRDVQCAQCHDHPLVTDYEQSEYFGIRAFLNRTYLFEDPQRGNRPLLGERAEGTPEFSSVFHPEDAGQQAELVLPMGMAMDTEPEYLDESEAYLVPPEKERRGVPRYSRRQQLAVLATHPENQSFNRNLANRLWVAMMGRGVVHPVDMHHSDNPPASAALLRALAEELVACGYDLRAFLGQIAKSAAYQRSSRMPDLQYWAGPTGGVAMIDARLAARKTIEADRDLEQARLRNDLTAATQQLERARQAVSELQVRIDKAKQELQSLTAAREAVAAALAEVRESQSEDSAAEQLREDFEDANHRVEDQRSRVLSLTNRRLALGEFVVEARGVWRRVQNQQQALDDALSDDEQERQQLIQLREWLVIRDEITRAAPPAGAEGTDGFAAPETDAGAGLSTLTERLELAEAGLVESWRNGFACHRVRGLTPEQLAGAIYTALEMGRSVREQATQEWSSLQESEPVEGNGRPTLEEAVGAAMANHLWDTVEDEVVDRFSAPAGAPQDGFFATVDQALMIQNAPVFQGWLAPSDGNLVERLMSVTDADELARQAYLSVLGRPPEPEETEMVVEMLSRFPDERPTIIQELVWGLLSSSEFRFMQ